VSTRRLGTVRTQSLPGHPGELLQPLRQRLGCLPRSFSPTQSVPTTLRRNVGLKVATRWMLRLSTGDVVDHIQRFKAVYQLAVDDPADGECMRRLCADFTQ